MKDNPLEAGYKGFFMEESLRKAEKESSPPSSQNILKRDAPKGSKGRPESPLGSISPNQLKRKAAKVPQGRPQSPWEASGKTYFIGVKTPKGSKGRPESPLE